MPDMTDILDAEAGEEPDAIRRALAEDMLEMTSPRRPLAGEGRAAGGPSEGDGTGPAAGASRPARILILVESSTGS